VALKLKADGLTLMMDAPGFTLMVTGTANGLLEAPAAVTVMLLW
jgi:hypothetical protein